MFVLGDIVRSLAYFCNILFTILYWMLVIRVLLSWFGIDPYSGNELLRLLYHMTDMILAPFRRLRLQVGMFDLSPIVAFLVLALVQRLLVHLLYELAYRLG